MGVRGKLISLFVIIKVVPLVLLAWFAWSMANDLGRELSEQFRRLTKTADETVATVGDVAVADSINALDSRARDDIERQTTDTARRVADFLYGRDEDVLLAATLAPDAAAYGRFLERRTGQLIDHGDWELAPDGKSWQPRAAAQPKGPAVDFGVKDNAREYHYRHPDNFRVARRPLYLEMTFVGLDGREVVKVTTSDRVRADKVDVSRRADTFAKAESYFQHLKALKPGEIYVSDVIGTYVGSQVVGHYTPEAAEKAGVAYDPRASAYAGKENPVGRRFQGLVRWATPVVRDGKVAGWVTLALDHDHILEFTDHQVPTAERYSDIPDAAAGNYAFIWDRFARNIAHPRHYFIVGYDGETGEPQIPWLEDRLYDDFQASGRPYAQFIKDVPVFRDQGLDKKPAAALTRQGLVGLDCRYLNFAPQCVGWHNLTSKGGSGSFVILWSGIWKLTTAAAIPYYTGQYGASPRGFGFVTIGANIDEFHRAANDSKGRLDLLVSKADAEMRALETQTQDSISHNLAQASQRLTVSTIIMVAAVIAIAVWMASGITARIQILVAGLARFRSGERGFRFGPDVPRDEMGLLAQSFDSMADTIENQLVQLEREIDERARTEEQLRAIHENLETLVDERTAALTDANEKMRVEIEERAAAEERVRYLANHDALTGLANRLLFHERLGSGIATARRSGKYMGLLFLDLDRFKQVNDSQGHPAGDILLKHVAAILESSVRATDLVARLGGDEFAILLADIDGPDAAAKVAQNIIDQLGGPFDVEGHTIHTGTSIGITLFPGDTDDPDQLLLHGDLAMYQAKAEGGNCYHFFAQALHEQVLVRKRLESELRAGIVGSEFVAYYQPRIDTVGNRVTGVEALLRWNHPERGVLAPGAFMEVAEKSGILPAIDAIVLDQACRQAASWVASGVDFGRMAVNISPRDLSAPEFSDNVLRILDAAGLAPNCLELEITERAIIQHYEAAIGNLKRLRERGIKIAIDDFGTDHSSLQRLIECPVDVIKVDRYFVSRIGDTKSEAVISAIVAMGASIQVELVAEGVETQDQLAYLNGLGCSVIQGFLCARPMNAEDAARHIQGLAPVPA